MSDVREFDLVLVGATGFVGRLTAVDLAGRAGADLRIGLAGRSSDKLRALRAELPAAAKDWPLITTDINDDASAAGLAERTRVMVTTVGPYLRYGLPLVSACAAAGTHYADLSGETLFVRRSIDAAHERAQSTGARIVHSCGFDSVPSDLGVGLAAQRAAADDAGAVVEAVLHITSIRTGISGGTIDSLRQQVLEIQQDPTNRDLAAHAWALVDDPSGRPYGAGSRRANPLGLDRSGPDGSWEAPYVMGGYNRQIVHRTNALLDWPYGREFRYREVVDTGRGLPGALRAAGVSVGTGAVLGGMWLRPTRAILDRLLPAPGKGPDERTRRNGRITIEVRATTSTGARYCTTIAAALDPGYGGTAIMLVESALSLASDPLDERAGVLTPMVALGPHLADRLRTRGFTVSAEREE